MASEVDATKNTGHSLKSPYGYTPDAWLGYLFLVLFGLSTAAHLFQLTRYRLWWLIPTICFCGILELVGWAGRLWSSYNVLLNTPYTMQIVCTILAPTPLVAASFVMLGQCIRRLGQQYSRLSAKWYTIVFCSCDVIALIIQALGGGAASAAVNSGKSPTAGSDIMLAGIIFQMAAITFYMLLASEFVLRYLYDRPVNSRASEPTPYALDKSMKQMLAALVFSSLCIYLRSWYRTIELAGGWNGYVIHTQRYFVVMDAMMITFAMVVMNVFHPGRLLGAAPTWNGDISLGGIDKSDQAVEKGWSGADGGSR
ncbi:uncharacterized protein FIBRA_06757 [Fibroporia radiculosa]|uniref:RTA1 like protein n=1 Tax=Fibroporia radiculosa TaxID=599839 RepID=J4IBF6_9APHY|nr:uncharacterized protein FIBRA_06757 [Fibroporia radiculosa]CCM04576.1 predicted protein [Fibroporia radiculosa]